MQRYSQRLNATVATQCNGSLTPSCAVWSSNNLPSTPDELCYIAANLPADSTSPVAAAKSVRGVRMGGAVRVCVWLAWRLRDVGSKKTKTRMPFPISHMHVREVKQPTSTNSWCTPIFCTTQDCLLLDEATTFTQSRLVSVMELTGAPYSVGDAKGEGVRLVLGGNATVSTLRQNEITDR